MNGIGTESKSVSPPPQASKKQKRSTGLSLLKQHQEQTFSHTLSPTRSPKLPASSVNGLSPLLDIMAVSPIKAQRAAAMIVEEQPAVAQLVTNVPGASLRVSRRRRSTNTHKTSTNVISVGASNTSNVYKTLYQPATFMPSRK